LLHASAVDYVLIGVRKRWRAVRFTLSIVHCACGD